ncbi:MAG: hypothetical protein AAF414_20790 [Pseudomonadota bacterium]
MPLRNRVRPDGEIVADPTRGLFMGNRGRLLGRAGEIARQWQVRRWICCVTSFRDRRVPVMSERRYTALFFLDEATALAAGHRPCAECRWGDFNRFIDAWRTANGPAVGRIYVDAIDRLLHAQRIDRARGAQPAELVNGAMVSTGKGEAYLYWYGRFHRWTPLGYENPVDRLAEDWRLLTPRATLATLREGYRPVIHPSLESPL